MKNEIENLVKQIKGDGLALLGLLDKLKEEGKDDVAEKVLKGVSLAVGSIVLDSNPAFFVQAYTDDDKNAGLYGPGTLKEAMRKMLVLAREHDGGKYTSADIEDGRLVAESDWVWEIVQAENF